MEGRKKKVKSILISQPKPESGKSPYFSLAQKHKLKIDFIPFIHVEEITTQEFKTMTFGDSLVDVISALMLDEVLEPLVSKSDGFVMIEVFCSWIDETKNVCGARRR